MSRNILLDFIEYATQVSSGDPITASLIGSGLAAILTTLGALAALVARTSSSVLSPRGVGGLLDVGLGFSSGVMLVASFTSLLLPAIEMSGYIIPVLGFLSGVAVIHLVDKLVPHEHMVRGYEGPPGLREKVRAAWLVALAIIIHNIPEGMAIGFSTAYSIEMGLATSIAIALQDLPEGAAVALPIAVIRGSRLLGLFYGVLSGVSEILVAVPSAMLGAVTAQLLPFMLGFGAGAMVYVVSHEALPESHRTGHETGATLGFFTGFLLMLYLDTLLG